MLIISSKKHKYSKDKESYKLVEYLAEKVKFKINRTI